MIGRQLGGMGVRGKLGTMRRAIGLQRALGKHLNLVLPTNRDFLAPAVDRGATDAKRLGQRCLATKKPDGFVSAHEASLAWHTSDVNNTIQEKIYAQGMANQTITDRINLRFAEMEAEAGSKLSDAELGRRVGVERSTIGDWRKGRSVRITPENLVALADAMGVEIRWLATGQGPKLVRKPQPRNYVEAHELLDQSPPEIVASVSTLLRSQVTPPLPK